ncbi:MAG: RnfABCDGE type electron transport complex subunit B [Alphaproteobacteria bacterium]|nr:RnfABCDGE type electron transport complex subunit B [Alphaproteobacteria bacterium]
MVSAILFNILILSGLAVLAAIVLYWASQKFAVQESPLVGQIYEILPHANCGACGRAGCQDFASICANASAEEFQNLNCPVGGRKVMEKIATLKGVQAGEAERKCAVLRCNGSCQNAPDKVVYTGMKSCRAAHSVMSGRSGCPNGCLRMGDCVQVCQYGALSLDKETGLPVVDYKKCTSCGACVKRCPRGLFEIRPIQENMQVYVACRNQQKGAVARKNCKVACIACGKCRQINDTISIENNLSYIPPSISAPEEGEKLAASCPVKAIHFRQNMIEGD